MKVTRLTRFTSTLPASAKIRHFFSIPVFLALGFILVTAVPALAQWTAVIPVGEAPGDRFGNSVAPAGDVNGDGYDDLIVGALYANGGTGSAYVFYGGPTVDDLPDLVFRGEANGDRFGYHQAVAGAGDFDGDGYDDLLVGAGFNDTAGTDAGRAYVFLGGPAADTVPDLILDGEAAGDYFGMRVAVVGDVDGDGFDDFIIGANGNDAGGYYCGRAYVFHGGPDMDATADLVLTGEGAGDRFGVSVCGTGDMNGDGFVDIAVGAVYNDGGGTDAGRLYVFFMGPTADGVADLVFTGVDAGEWMGTSVASPGDVNGDGYRDLVIGAQYNDVGGSPDAGRAYVYFCGPGHDQTPDLVFTGEAWGDHLGKDVAAAGDLNRDGFPDILLGVPFHDTGGSQAGRAYVHFGGPGADEVPDLIYTGTAAGDELGGMVCGAFDLNGDGCDDFAITVPGNDAAGANAGLVYIWVSDPTPATIWGQVTADSPDAGTPLLGVTINIHADDSGDLVGSSVTDDAGYYRVEDLAPGAGYTVRIVTPLGFSAVTEEVPVTLACCDEITVDFPLNQVDITAAPRNGGFWRRQVLVALHGPDNSIIDPNNLCELLDTIAASFNHNGYNAVVVYEPPASNLCEDKLSAARAVLSPRGRQSVIDRARQQLLALLLNVAAGYISQTEVISSDGATVSQAITYCDRLLDDPQGDHQRACVILMEINGGRSVQAGAVPPTTPRVAYRVGHQMPLPLALPELAPNIPNPFNPVTRIRFTLPHAQPVRVVVYALDGRRVKVLLDDIAPQGWSEILWTGIDAQGRAVPSGTYFCRLETSGFATTRQMLLIK